MSCCRSAISSHTAVVLFPSERTFSQPVRRCRRGKRKHDARGLLFMFTFQRVTCRTEEGDHSQWEKRILRTLQPRLYTSSRLMGRRPPPTWRFLNDEKRRTSRLHSAVKTAAQHETTRPRYPPHQQTPDYRKTRHVEHALAPAGGQAPGPLQKNSPPPGRLHGSVLHVHSLFERSYSTRSSRTTMK